MPGSISLYNSVIFLFLLFVSNELETVRIRISEKCIEESVNTRRVTSLELT